MSDESKSGSRKVRNTGSPKKDKGERAQRKAAKKPEEEDKFEIEISTSEVKHPRSQIKPLTTDNSLLTTEMEVHHHPRLDHNSKPWKEYILEGLMIFLAVFMGFVAENIREHIVEKNRSTEYMKEMVDNLKFDTLRCSVNMPGNIDVALGLDSFRAVLKQAIAGHINSNKLYYFAVKYDGEINIAVFNTSAMTELRSSGSLRLIGNKKLIADMADYYDRRLVAAQKFIPEEQSREMRKVIREIFSWTYFDERVNTADKLNKKFKGDYDPGKLLSITPAPKLLKTKVEDLQRLYTAVCDFEFKLKYYDFFLNYVKSAAVPLMKSIQTEYDLKDE